MGKIEDNPDIPVVEEKQDETLGEMMGQCKWFNDKLGFGFLSIISNGDKKGTDIFIHHSAIKTKNSHYKTLRKGEYVQFDIGESTIKGPNVHQATNVTGILGGPLMCDCVTTFIPPPPQSIPHKRVPLQYMNGHHPPPPPPSKYTPKSQIREWQNKRPVSVSRGSYKNKVSPTENKSLGEEIVEALIKE